MAGAVMIHLLIPLVLQDTVRLDAATALARAVARAPVVAAAEARVRAATLAGREAGRLPNLQLGVVGENFGMQRQVTGRDGLAGVEGQVTLLGRLPLGGDLGAARAGAAASVAVARSEAAGVRQAVEAELLQSIAAHQQQHRLLAAATAESEAMDRFAAAMTAREAEGRVAAGEAARVRTEAVLVASQLARRRADVAATDARLATAVGESPDTPIRIELAAACGPAVAGTPVVVQRAEARAALAQAMVRDADARAIPDLLPQAGFRRTAGFSGVLLGFGLDLPLFSSGSGGRAAARADLEATAFEREQTERLRQGTILAETRAVADLEALGARYDTAWSRDLDRAVAAAESRWAEGAGTLAELFDARRMRLVALDEQARHRERLLAARLALAAARGIPLTTTLLLDDCPGALR